MDYSEAPEYLKAADLHNVGSGGESFFDAPLDNVGDFVSKVPSFAVTSVVSGVNSIFNSAIAAGNFLGVTDAEENDTHAVLMSYDTDLAQYYTDHKQAVDLTGFIATSLVPGIAGVKALNYGQKALSGVLRTGGVGRTIAEATGLIQTVTAEGKTIAQVAGAALAESGQVFSFANAGVMRAVAAGTGQAVLEGMAFEAMVNATMFRSPILEGQDIRDLGSHVLTAGLLNGAIGGALSAAKTYGTVKGIIKETDLAQKPFVARESQAALTEPSDNIVVAAFDKLNTPKATTPAEETLVAKRIEKTNLDIKLYSHKITDGDTELGNLLGDTLIAMPDANQIANSMSGAKMVFRAGANVVPSEGHVAGYVQMHGVDDVGKVVLEDINPKSLTLADRLRGKVEVDNYVKSAGFSTSKEYPLINASSMDDIRARYIWADKIATYKEGMKINIDDIPLLEGAMKSGVPNIVIKDGTYEYTVVASELRGQIINAKRTLADEIVKQKGKGWGINVGTDSSVGASTATSDEIAEIVNVSKAFLESTPDASAFARQDAQIAYTKKFADAGIKPVQADLDYVPKHIGIIYDSARVGEVNGDTVAAMVRIKQQQKIAQEAIDIATASVLEDLTPRAVHPTQDMILNSNRYGAGAGVISHANGSYGSLASWSESIGKLTSDLSTKLMKATSEATDSIALKLRSNQSAAMEFDKLNNLASSSIHPYVLNDAGDGLIIKAVKNYHDAVSSGKAGVKMPTLQEGAIAEIKFIHPETAEAITARIQTNGNRVDKMTKLKNALGLEDTKQVDVFYPVKPQPREYPYFAFVKDESVEGAARGHTTMIHATSESHLNDMIKSVQERTGYKVYTKNDTKQFFEAQKSYEFDRTLHDNYMDAQLKSRGINSQFFPKTDPDKIVDSWVALEHRADTVLARETISTKFAHEFDQLQTLGDHFTNTASSRYGVTQKAVESTVKNPYNDYRKTALNISRIDEYPLLTNINRSLEKAVSETYQKVQDAWMSSSSVVDLEKVNKALKEAGVSHSYNNAAEVLLANHTAPKPILSNFIRGANSILASTFLRLDPLNALNNSIGAQVLLGHETSLLIKNIRAGNSAVAGELAQLAHIAVPGIEKASILSTPKLVARANANFFSHLRGDVPELTAMYKSNSWMTNTSQQFKSMLDDLTLAGTESPAQMTTKLERAMAGAKALTEKGAKFTGNNLAEEYNRFVAADVARQISDLGVKAGVLTPESQLSYISTFVNRTQGNTLASQRPLLFQGPIGQAIGLFQGFQFNTMQQLFRGVAEGGAKDAAMLLGLQGTMYGLNGLPGFQFINQHIIGTASGNKNHTDAYSTIYGTMGKTAGEWLMYGLPSNMLQTNLYTRGDINPRNITVVPVNPADIVAVSAFGKFAGNMYETLGKMAGGGNIWQSFLQGLEHNVLSRPLAGLAQTLQATANPEHQVFSTTNAGNVNFVNDFMSLATLSRLAGGKPLDEALANDEVARQFVYKAADKVRMNKATEKFKTAVIGNQGGMLPQGAVEDYMKAFVNNGGRQENFNKQILSIMTKTNTPRANEISSALKGPYAERMKLLMGGSIQELEQPSMVTE